MTGWKLECYGMNTPHAQYAMGEEERGEERVSGGGGGE